MNTEVKNVETQPCGCMVTHYRDDAREPYYQPCLPCALVNAGLMLQEAGNRLREERPAPQPGPAKDYIDGNRK